MKYFFLCCSYQTQVSGHHFKIVFPCSLKERSCQGFYRVQRGKKGFCVCTFCLVLVVSCLGLLFVFNNHKNQLAQLTGSNFWMSVLCFFCLCEARCFKGPTPIFSVAQHVTPTLEGTSESRLRPISCSEQSQLGS